MIQDDIKVGDYVRWEPTPGSPWASLTIDGTVIEMHETQSGQRVRMLRVTSVSGELPPIRWRHYEVPRPSPDIGSLVDVTFAPGVVRRIATTIRTPAGDIPMIASPTLMPGEFRIENRPQCATNLPVNPGNLTALEAIFDEYYPRDENGRHYLPPMPKFDLSKIRKSPPASPREWIKPVAHEPPPRSDGFDQHRIDEIKAMLTAQSKGKR